MTMATSKLIILDRYGVINEDADDYIKSPAEWRPIPESLEAIARLNQNCYRVAVATNQAGLARGLFDMHALNAIHQKLHLAAHTVGAHVDAIFFCPHAPEDFCDCRNPRPGMLRTIGQRFNSQLSGIPFVGDSLRDLQAAFEVGCTPYLVRTGKGMRTIETGGMPPGTIVLDNLVAVADHLLNADRLTTDTVELARSALLKEKNK